MTKVTILGQDGTKKEAKKIEFIKCINPDLNKVTPNKTPDSWENIILLSRKYTEDELDLIYCYNDNIDYGVLYLGHFNDGIV